MQCPPQTHYLPATELGGILGSPANTTVSTGVHPSSLYTDAAALGQHEILDMTCCSNSKLTLGASGQFFNTTATTGSATDQPSYRTDAVSAVFTEDEKAMLGSLHYSLGAITAATAAPVHAAFAGDVLPCASPSNNAAAAASSAFTDQLQGMFISP